MGAGIQSLPKELLLRVFGDVTTSASQGSDERSSDFSPHVVMYPSPSGQSINQSSRRVRIQASLETLARVSKMFNAICTELLYQEIEVENADAFILLLETFMHHNPERCNLVQKFGIFRFVDGNVPPLLCKRLLACDFPAMQTMFLESRLSENLSLIPDVPCLARLLSLTLVGTQIPMLSGSTFPNLKDLALHSYSEASPHFFPSFPALQTLSLVRVKASASVCDWLRAAVKSIKVLRIIAPNQRTTGGLELFQAMPADVEEVDFTASQERDSDIPSLAVYLARLKRLRRLRLSGNSATDLLDIVPSYVDALELVFDKVDLEGLGQLFRQLQSMDTLPSLKSLLLEVRQFRSTPTAELKEACQKASESLTSRGVRLLSPAKTRWDVWNPEAAIWSQQVPAPQAPMVFLPLPAM